MTNCFLKKKRVHDVFIYLSSDDIGIYITIFVGSEFLNVVCYIYFWDNKSLEHIPTLNLLGYNTIINHHKNKIIPNNSSCFRTEEES